MPPVANTTTKVLSDRPRDKKVKPVPYSKQEVNYRQYMIHSVLETARDRRDQKHEELDDMTYVQYWNENRKKDLTHLRAKKNKHDKRIESGLTREKDTTLLSSLLGLDLQPNVSAFDEEDLFVAELGENTQDLVEKSRRLEDWRKKRPIIYRELISQGDVFVEETYVERYQPVPSDQIQFNPIKDSIGDFNTKEAFKKVYEGAEVNLLDGRMVYRGNIKEEYIENDQAVITREVMSRDEAEAIYGQWERWKYVPYGLDKSELQPSDGTTYKDWWMYGVNDDQVEILKIQQKFKNRYMIMINGVMMLPIDFPLTAIAPDGEYTVVQGKLEPISHFAYSKGIPAKTKIDDEVLGEILRLMIEKMRQSYRPPMGNKSGKVYSAEIFNAGVITEDIDKEQFFPMLDPSFIGLNNSDFSFYQFMKEAIDEKSVSDTFSGNIEGNPTATQVIEEQKQQMMKLGLAMDGVINLETSLVWKRIHTIYTKWTDPIDTRVNATRTAIEDVYKRVTVDTTLPEGRTGRKVFQFGDFTDGFPEESAQFAEERELGGDEDDVRIVYMNSPVLRQMRYMWYVTMNPEPKNNDALAQLLFLQNVRTAIELFGPQSLNQEYLKQRFAVLIGEDYNKMFRQMTMEEILMQMQNQTNPDVAKNAVETSVRPDRRSDRRSPTLEATISS